MTGRSGHDGGDVDDPGDLPRGARDGARLLVRVYLPDRPGALGHVAARIGAIGGDIVGVDILERSDEVAIDEFAVVLPSAELVGLLVREIGEVDGASVEGCHLVERFPDPRLDALVSAELLCRAATAADLHRVLVDSVRDEFEADWAAVLHGGAVTAGTGEGTPDAASLSAIAGRSLIDDEPSDIAGEDSTAHLAVTPLPLHDAVLLMGRAEHPFRRRELRQLLVLARIADRVANFVTS